MTKHKYYIFVICIIVHIRELEGWTEDCSSWLEQSSWPVIYFGSSELSIPEYAANMQEPDDEEMTEKNATWCLLKSVFSDYKLLFALNVSSEARLRIMLQQYVLVKG